VKRLVVLAFVLAACEPPPLTLRFKITNDDAQQCISDTNGNPTTDCRDITLECGAVLSIRIVPPSAPKESYVKVCEPVHTTKDHDLCAIAGIDLKQPDKPIPEQVLEVQMAVFPASAVHDIDLDGSLDCPLVQFGADGLPVASIDPADGGALARPAIGGRAFYHPGDTETVVELGCSEPRLLGAEMCNGTNRTDVTATVNEFEYPAAVDLATANRLFVSIGEPTFNNSTGNYALDSSRTKPLQRTLAASLPSWEGSFVDFGITSSFCIEVLEDAPLTTRTVTCRKSMPNPSDIDATGIRLKSETLATILKAFNGPGPSFPTKGLVVGIVLNSSFAPVLGAQVTATCGMMCPIKYLSADKQSFTSGPMERTSSNGIWISEDAPYLTVFSKFPEVNDVLGGTVENKVTIVVLQEPTVGM